MHIIIDAMGGDNAPQAIVEGALAASDKYGLDITLVGDEAAITPLIDSTVLHPHLCGIVDAKEVIEMNDNPLTVLRTKKEASMPKALRLLRDEGDALVSAGSTGTLLLAATHYLRNIRGISRSAIATILPMREPVLLLDSGANLGMETEALVQWAYMGTLYMRHTMGILNPRVGLLNNGTEECKGPKPISDAYAQLKARGDLNFVGNIEAREVPNAPCDVLVADGFSGNLLMKTLEGTALYMKGMLSETFRKTPFTKLAYLTVKKPLKEQFKALSAETTGGAPILGLTRPVIKAHGNSNAAAICSAVRQAAKFAAGGMIPELEKVATSFLEV